MADDALVKKSGGAFLHASSGIKCGDDGCCQCQPSAAEAREFRKVRGASTR
jgi:hypothetical protein